MPVCACVCLCVSVCLCVYVRERERERGGGQKRGPVQVCLHKDWRADGCPQVELSQGLIAFMSFTIIIFSTLY